MRMMCCTRNVEKHGNNELLVKIYFSSLCMMCSLIFWFSQWWCHAMNLAAFLGISLFMMTSSNAKMRTMVYGCQCVEQVQLLLPSTKKNHVMVRVHAVSSTQWMPRTSWATNCLIHGLINTCNFIKVHVIEGNVLG